MQVIGCRMKFNELKINKELIRRAEDNGFDSLTAIQEQCIPHVLKGKDVVGQAETGSGKTLAFALPIIENAEPGKGIQALILTPTRELCVQVTDVFKEFGKPIGVKALSVYGGVGIEPQIRNLKIAEVVVGTPGRILDHIGRQTVDFRRVKTLVLDETDKMFEMGFIDDVERIMSYCPKNRQTLMFSATIFDQVLSVMRRHLKNPHIVRTKSQVDAKKLKQVYYDIYNQNSKFSLLVHLIRHKTPGLAIVFCATRDQSDIIAKNLRNHKVNALAIHGGMTQNRREKSLQSLKNEHIDVLVATDVAARGLDIKNVTHVYNYDVSKTTNEYLHRIGRTARAGEKGDAVTLLTQRDHDNFRRITQDDELNIEKAEMPKFERLQFDMGRRQNFRGFNRGGRGGGRNRRDDRSSFGKDRKNKSKDRKSMHRKSY